MLPLSKFKDVLINYQEQMVQDFNELIMAADLIGSRPNYLTVDEKGFYHVQASGTLDEAIKAMEQLLEKLNRIKKQKNDCQ
jgi:vacuolar-type H+-ATPase subunit D/Vma8